MRLFHTLGALALLAVSSMAVDILPALADAVPNQYLVMLTPNMLQAEFDTAMGLVTRALGQNDKVMHKYFFGDFRGFSIEASMTAMNVVRNIPGVQMVEQNHALQQEQKVTQRDSTYGLDRISHRRSAAAANRSPYTFIYFRPVGKGTTIYVIDSGIYIDHDDFTGRATKGHMYAPDNTKGNPNTFTDFTGHGTHVASIAAGYDYGVAKAANIVDVKVFNDAGESSAIYEVAGISYAVNDAQEHNAENKSVINMSFGGPAGPDRGIVGYAVRSATTAGVLCVAAAGNNAKNADTVSPANIPEACTVGATNSTDFQAPFSNFGDSLDIWAPGVNILAAIPGGRDATGLKNGTSMAAPYVSGVAAYLKAGVARYGTYDPVRFCQEMVNDGTKGMLKYAPYAVPTGPNVLLYDLGGADE